MGAHSHSHGGSHQHVARRVEGPRTRPGDPKKDDRRRDEARSGRRPRRRPNPNREGVNTTGFHALNEEESLTWPPPVTLRRAGSPAARYGGNVWMRAPPPRVPTGRDPVQGPGPHDTGPFI